MNQLIQYVFLRLLLPQTTRTSKNIMSYAKFLEWRIDMQSYHLRSDLKFLGNSGKIKEVKIQGCIPAGTPNFKTPRSTHRCHSSTSASSSHTGGSIPSTQVQRAAAPGIPLPRRTAVRDRQCPAELLGSATPWNMFYLIQNRNKPTRSRS